MVLHSTVFITFVLMKGRQAAMKHECAPIMLKTCENIGVVGATTTTTI
ncbi:hypothetical protein BVRB_006800 [Beta vulgaris subsp. vulgaris]|uniref:Uncharacterized protein n=1 Tax=Beta vulgaris subsp. vulgaris TaxID=3555 RepID=A0A0J8B734_BETVV|nr:hypothetical protein BVRB_006800 [Beta vulgaris subsp. vulgaris]